MCLGPKVVESVDSQQNCTFLEEISSFLFFFFFTNLIYSTVLWTKWTEEDSWNLSQKSLHYATEKGLSPFHRMSNKANMKVLHEQRPILIEMAGDLTFRWQPYQKLQ